METFDALQRDKWMTPLDSMRYALLDTVHGTTKSIGALPQWISTRSEHRGLCGGRSARSMWAALWTEVQTNDTSECFIFGHPRGGHAVFEGPPMEQWRLTLAQSGEVRWEDEAGPHGSRRRASLAPTLQVCHLGPRRPARRGYPPLSPPLGGATVGGPMVWTHPDSAGACTTTRGRSASSAIGGGCPWIPRQPSSPSWRTHSTTPRADSDSARH